MAPETGADPQLAVAEIVVGVDGSAGADRALRWAAATAAARGRRLRVVHGLGLETTLSMFGTTDLVLPDVIHGIRTQAAAMLEAAAGFARRVAPELTVETELVDATVTRALVERSASAHLTVLGATGTGGTVAHLGSTLLNVVAHGHGSVVVVRDAAFEQRAERGGPVVVGVDGSTSAPALAAAFAEASERGADLVAVHAWIDLPPSREGATGEFDNADLETAAATRLAEQLAGWSAKYPEVTVERRVYLSGPRTHLLRWSRTAQLVVVGSRGRGGFTGLLLGSTGNTLVQRAHCPVLVAHTH
ncbi:universal stress protein [Nocardia jiangsuensis]|uniref:Universal stress protein n=1 Tax=Nocardia jiangsuensis TaxID=1691563 RepID=A0ABV8DNE4_9NOCA